MSGTHQTGNRGASTLVLLVDRDDDTREMYSEFLKDYAIEIHTAADGRDGLAKAIALAPDIVITDTRLAGIDGYELCSLLRRDATTCQTPILVVTGDGFEADVARARDAGADAVLVKPCLPPALLTEIQKLVRRSQRPKPARPHGSPPEVALPAPRARTRTPQARAKSRTFNRHDTTTPPEAPPNLLCPACDHPLVYQRSHIGGVNERNAEQWDDFECPAGCGRFQYRQRTRTLRKVS
jgi:DNA-binding response OmpR family regulator